MVGSWAFLHCKQLRILRMAVAAQVSVVCIAQLLTKYVQRCFLVKYGLFDVFQHWRHSDGMFSLHIMHEDLQNAYQLSG